MTPKQITEKLDAYIIGQDKAKKVVAIALRNRYRRAQLSETLQEEITPKNIIMKGPTGVGKTEIARRLAKIVGAPFVKVEATKFTEVGYVGRDVESMIKELVEAAVRMVKKERTSEVFEKAKETSYRKISTAIAKSKGKNMQDVDMESLTKDVLQDIKDGKYDDMQIEVEVNDNPKNMEIQNGMGGEINLGDMFGGILPKKKKRRKVKVKDALKIVAQEEAEKLIDEDSINAEAIERAQSSGIIFIDELDKICGGGGNQGPNVSREGVQRDILPIVEGCTVVTKYGAIKTDYILFIAAGAFHISKYSDLIPELQGRFPVTVDLASLSKEDFYKIMTVPENSIIKQYVALLETEKVHLQFEESGLREIASIAFNQNISHEDIGARRLHTIVENLLEEESFNAGENSEEKTVVIDEKYVSERIKEEAKKVDLKKYIL
ncbi:MAG: ATP-dependent protease ATPase subunit HslU [Bacillota bacterium]